MYVYIYIRRCSHVYVLYRESISKTIEHIIVAICPDTQRKKEISSARRKYEKKELNPPLLSSQFYKRHREIESKNEILR